MPDKNVPRRTFIGAAVIAAQGLMTVRPAGAAVTAPKEGTSATAPTVSDAELRMLIDKSAIVEMVSRLGKWLDLNQFDDPAINQQLFVPEVTVETPGGPAEGIDLVVAKARARHGKVKTQHLHTNVLVDLQGDVATAEANLQVTFVADPAKPGEFSQVGTRYFFELVRVGPGWKFRRIHDRMIWRRDAPSPAKS